MDSFKGTLFGKTKKRKNNVLGGPVFYTYPCICLAGCSHFKLSETCLFDKLPLTLLVLHCYSPRPLSVRTPPVPRGMSRRRCISTPETLHRNVRCACFRKINFRPGCDNFGLRKDPGHINLSDQCVICPIVRKRAATQPLAALTLTAPSSRTT